MPRKIRIGLAHHFQLLNDGLFSILEHQPQFEVVAMVHTAAQALHMARTLRPTVLICDLHHTDRHILDLVESLLGLRYAPRIITMLISPQLNLVERLLKIGVQGLLAQESRASDLVDAVNRVAGNMRYLPPNFAKNLMEYQSSIKDPSLADLSKRQYQVALLMAEGLSTKAIAEHLNISDKTVWNHREQVMERLKLSTSVEVCRFLIRHGAMEP